MGYVSKIRIFWKIMSDTSIAAIIIISFSREVCFCKINKKYLMIYHIFVKTESFSIICRYSVYWVSESPYNTLAGVGNSMECIPKILQQ